MQVPFFPLSLLIFIYHLKNPESFFKKLSGFLAGLAGFEPASAAVKVLCLTA